MSLDFLTSSSASTKKKKKKKKYFITSVADNCGGKAKAKRK